MDLDVLALRGKTEPEAYAETLTREALSSLVPLFQEKDDVLRYAAFLTLVRAAGQHPTCLPTGTYSARNLQMGIPDGVLGSVDCPQRQVGYSGII